MELEQHPNVYYTYTEEGLMKQSEVEPTQQTMKPKASKRPASGKKRPSSKTSTSTATNGSRQPSARKSGKVFYKFV